MTTFRSRPEIRTLPLLGLLGLAGCGPGPAAPSADARPLAGVTVRFHCPDARLAGLLTPLARVWAARTGATLEPAAGDGYDVGVVTPAELGRLAAGGELLPVPPALRDPGNPYQWSGVLAAYRAEPLAGWGGRVYGLPLAGAGEVVVYRADRFADEAARKEYAARYKRPLAPPATWEELAEVAAFFAARDKKPSLPPLPADPARLVGLFSRVAASYDRPAAGEASAGTAGRGELGFYDRAEDGRPRLTDPKAGFGRAAGWLAGLRGTGGLPADGPADPAALLADGRAVLAVLTLDELRTLRGRGDLGRYGIAAVPGTRGFADPTTGALVPSAGNLVPHFAGGWFGVVRAGCPQPAAAWELVAELGGPGRGLEVVAAGGYGPVRDAHLDRERLAVWYGYGFDADRTRALQDALRVYAGKTVRNPTYGLRGPDAADRTARLAAELAGIAAGTVPPAEGLQRAAAAWDEAAKGTPPDVLRDWRRKALGLN